MDERRYWFREYREIMRCVTSRREAGAPAVKVLTERLLVRGDGWLFTASGAFDLADDLVLRQGYAAAHAREVVRERQRDALRAAAVELRRLRQESGLGRDDASRDRALFVLPRMSARRCGDGCPRLSSTAPRITENRYQHSSQRRPV
jgi:hypothetical protein